MGNSDTWVSSSFSEPALGFTRTVGKNVLFLDHSLHRHHCPSSVTGQSPCASVLSGITSPSGVAPSSFFTLPFPAEVSWVPPLLISSRCSSLLFTSFVQRLPEACFAFTKNPPFCRVHDCGLLFLEILLRYNDSPDFSFFFLFSDFIFSGYSLSSLFLCLSMRH